MKYLVHHYNGSSHFSSVCRAPEESYRKTVPDMPTGRSEGLSYPLQTILSLSDSRHAPCKQQRPVEKLYMY